jgi:ribonuclease D
VQIAQARPTTLDELAEVPGLGDFALRRYGQAIRHAVERGRAHPQRHRPRPDARKLQKMLDPATRERYARLKEWRRARAEARGVEPDVILSNDALLGLARKDPRTREALLEVSGLGPWKAREYGDELLRVLNGEE